jgi:hypothetical protein
MPVDCWLGRPERHGPVEMCRPEGVSQRNGDHACVDHRFGRS